MHPENMPILYTFYGDDFTGSTDVLEQLASNGVPTVLFLKPPTPAHLAAFPEVQAIGIAGDSRSHSPEWMSEHLPFIFSVLKSFNAPIAHYKVCSTFDSSPTHGSIGRAIELGREVFHPQFIPIVVGAPHLRRYVAFGNLFAAAPDGAICRIDRHPMSHHPVTPMREVDLRIHLSHQSTVNIGLVDLTALQSSSTAAAALSSEIASGNQAILFDTVDTQTQSATGELLWHEAQQQPIFAAASSGLTAAIIHAWRKANLLPQDVSRPRIASASPLLILSGSCSPVTERQIRYALAHGYQGIHLDPTSLITDNSAVVKTALASLASGRNTILYTSLGPHNSDEAHGDQLGTAMGHLLQEILTHTGSVRRVLFCGGDTSSHAVQQLGLYALTWLASLQPGAPLCLAHADDPHSPMHHLEIVLKGGQVGTENFFDVVRGAAL